MNRDHAINHCLSLLEGTNPSDLQRAILAGSWDNLTYSEIAEPFASYEAEYVKQVGAAIWKELSERLGRNVGKKSFRKVLVEMPDPQVPTLTGGTGSSAKEPIAPWSPLRDRLWSWFETLDDRFEQDLGGGEKWFEWILQIKARRGFERVLVRGVDGEAGIRDLQGVLERLDQDPRLDEGWLVAQRRVAKGARDQAETDDRVYCYTVDELIDSEVDFEPYVTWLEAEVTSRRIPELYLPLGCQKDEVDLKSGWKVGRRVL